MMAQANHEDDDLAAEYVLGVLDADARAHVADRIDKDINFARLVSEWEERLSGLNEGYEKVQPPAHIKQAIDKQLYVEPATSGGILGVLTRFRIPILIAVLLIAVTPRVMNYFSTEQVIYTATITSIESYEVAFSAQITEAGLVVNQTVGQKPADKDYELWLVRSDGQVLTLGVLSAPLNPAGLDIPADSQLAISVEPIGGSPTGVATGPVVAIGPLQAV